MPETWLPVVGYEGFYEVSDQGRVRSLPRQIRWGDGTALIPGKVLKPMAMGRPGKPRLSVALHRDGKRNVRPVHQLVLEMFVGPRPAGMEGCHNNDISDDNRLVNLRWDTPSENIYDKVWNGRDHNANKTHCSKGHEFTPENTMLSKQSESRNSRRSCRTCKRESWRKWKAAKASC